MSLYTDAISQATTGAPRVVPRPKLTLVKVQSVIPTPHGNVVSGELVEGEYYGPGELVRIEHNVGFFKKLKKAAKAVGKGVAKGTKAVGKGAFKSTKFVAKTAVKVPFKVTKAVVKAPLKITAKVAKGAFKVTKKTGKVVAKGTKKSVKWVKKNPVKALALAALPAALPAFALYKGAKAVKKAVTGPSQPAALPPMEEPEVSMEEPTYEEEAYAEPESYPGESDEGFSEEENPDVLEAPEGEYSDEGGDEESYADEGEYSDEGEYEASDSEDAATEGDTMADEEYVGLDEIAGEEEWVGADEIAGARPMKKKPGPNAALVRQVGYQKTRRQPLPIESNGDIGAGASGTVTVTPQTLFRGRKIVIGTALAPNFTIQDIKVGNVSQTAAAGSIPGEAFGPTATGEDNMQMDTCQPGKTISMTVTNTSAGALPFRAVIFGDSIS